MAMLPTKTLLLFPFQPNQTTVCHTLFIIITIILIILIIMIIIVMPGFPHNPYNGVICNDVVAASGVFTTKELWKFAKCEFPKFKTCSQSILKRKTSPCNVAASIMAGGSHMQSTFNSIKLENPGYYCNSYTPPGGAPPDHHAMLTGGPGYSESKPSTNSCILD